MTEREVVRLRRTETTYPGQDKTDASFDILSNYDLLGRSRIAGKKDCEVVVRESLSGGQQPAVRT